MGQLGAAVTTVGCVIIGGRPYVSKADLQLKAPTLLYVGVGRGARGGCVGSWVLVNMHDMSSSD